MRHDNTYLHQAHNVGLCLVWQSEIKLLTIYMVRSGIMLRWHIFDPHTHGGTYLATLISCYLYLPLSSFISSVMFSSVTFLSLFLSSDSALW